MLDDLKYIHQRDAKDALGVAEKQPRQLNYEFEFEANFSGIENVVFAGMGGSALAALISRTWPGYKIPFEVCRQYHIPAYVSNKTLFIASSYSGNTEETVSGLAEAEAKGAQIVVIAGGGKLIETAKAKSYPHLILPNDAGNPRYAVFYSLNALVTVLEKLGVAPAGSLAELQKVAPFLDKSIRGWLPTVPTTQNPAKKLAMDLVGKSIVIYAGPLMSPAAYKWKISFNENSKNIAWWNEAPEWNHNETSGWLEQPVQRVYGVVDLRSNLEHERVQKRFDLLAKLLSGKRPAPETVQAEGNTILEQMLWTIVFGDFTSLYLALANNVDPSPVEVQEKIKVELNK